MNHHDYTHICIKLTDWLRSDWLEISFRSHSGEVVIAYRLASIGLVGNLTADGFLHHERPIRLPIGFDRIGWKPTFINKCTLNNSKTAYRLASIGLVGNSATTTSRPTYILGLITDWLRSDWLETLLEQVAQLKQNNRLPIGFDRIGWKLFPQGLRDDFHGGLPIGFDWIYDRSCKCAIDRFLLGERSIMD